MKSYGRLKASAIGMIFMVEASGCSAHEVGGKTVEQAFPNAPRVAELATAACGGRGSEVKQLVSSGVDPDAQGLRGITPLIWAITCENRAGMKALLEAGANPDLGAPDLVPLSVAATYDDPEMPKLLLQYKANPYTPRREGNHDSMDEAIYTYLRTRDSSVIFALLDHGYDINTRGKAGYGVADHLAILGQLDLVVNLIDRGYKPDRSSLIRWLNGRDYDENGRKMRAQIIDMLH